MLFSKAITELSQEVVKSEIDDKTLLKIKSALNFGKSEVSKYSLWSQLIVPNNELLIVPNYETGTAACVKDSRTVTLVGGGVVSTGFQGRYFSSNSRRSYEILSVDVGANTLTLKTPFIEDSFTGTFSIWKRWYRVPSDIRIVLPSSDYDDMREPFEIEGYDLYRSDISGQVSVAKDSNILTGSGFFDNVWPGDYIKVESNTYRVKYILSDTQIILTNKAVGEFSGIYTISSDTPHMARITNETGLGKFFYNGQWWGVNNTEKCILPYRYIRTLYDMVSDNDDTEMSHHFDRSMLDFAKAEYGRATNSDKWEKDLSYAQERLKKLEMDKDLVFHAKNEFKVDVPRGFGRGYPRNW